MKKLIRSVGQVTVRPLADIDYPAWRATHQRVGQKRNIWDHDPRSQTDLTKASFRKLIRAQKKNRDLDQFYDFGIFNARGEFAGMVSVMDVARRISQGAFLGYRIYNNHWRKGYGKDAVKAVIDIAFKDLKLHRLEAGIEPRNIRSIRLARSLGMRREGVKKRAIFLRGEWVDLVMYSLTTEDLGWKYDSSKIKHHLRA